MNTFPHIWILFFFFNDTATTEIYTLSLHDALPISTSLRGAAPFPAAGTGVLREGSGLAGGDRKSTRLNSSHVRISYAVFCFKKKKKTRRLYHIHNLRLHCRRPHLRSVTVIT